MGIIGINHPHLCKERKPTINDKNQNRYLITIS